MQTVTRQVKKKKKHETKITYNSSKGAGVNSLFIAINLGVTLELSRSKVVCIKFYDSAVIIR